MAVAAIGQLNPGSGAGWKKTIPGNITLETIPERVPMSLISLFVVLSLFFYNVAGAEVYDDFNSGSIDSAKWMIRHVSRDARGLFTQAGGRLLFSCDRDTGESLVSTRSFTAGFFRIAFHDIHSTNNSPPAQGKGSFAAIGLGPRSNYVRMLRGRVSTGGYFEANHFTNGRLQLWYVPTEVSSGRLGLLYDGSTVLFFFNSGLDPDKGWQKVGPTVTPGWKSPPMLFISGYPGASGQTSFAMDNLEYLPLPLQPGIIPD